MEKIMKNHMQHSHSLAMILSGIVLTLTCLLSFGDITNGSAAPARSTCQDIREIREIIVHCSATPEGRDYSVATLTAWHRQRGFLTIGYHYVIDLQGAVHIGRPLAMVGAHCRGHNARSIGVCYIGGVARDGRMPKDTRTEAQKEALARLLRELHARYPASRLHGHREFANKACPSFDCHEYDYIFNDARIISGT